MRKSTRLWLAAALASGVGVACGSVAPARSCATGADCGAGLVCVAGACTSASATDAGSLPDGATTDAPSCAAGGPGMTNCGGGAGSCCTSLPVSGGTFYRNYANAGSGPVDEADPATVSSFRLDEYEVTVGRFRQFVHALLGSGGAVGWLPADGSGKHTHLYGGLGVKDLSPGEGSWENGWSSNYDVNLATYEDPWATSNPVNENLSCGGSPGATWTPKAGAHENLPMNCVNWYDAYAFCIWDGGFLPTEAEWEYAAAGGDEQREYPWGSADPGTSNQYAIYGCLFPSPSGTCSDASNVAPVGTATRGAGKWGQLDLAGNVFEWTLDYWYQQYQSPCVDCALLTSVDDPFPTRSARGSSFERVGTSLLSPWYHSYEEEMDRSPYTGIRCARTP